VQENITGRTGLAAFMTSVSVSGYTPALSFVVNLSDMYGKTLYEKAGGLQILGYLRAEGFSVKLRQVDPQFIMAAPERDSRALAIALDPLVSGSNSDPKSKVELAPADIPEDLPALRISRDELFRSYSRIVIAPVELAPIEQATSVQQRYAQLLREKLMAAGMTVVGGDEYGPLWEAARISAGGFFDSYTGRKDDGRFNEARNQVFAKLHEQHGATAYVLPAIITRRATFQTGSAHWDGVKELATTSKSWAGTMMNPSARAVGEMNVQSIRVQIVDGTGRLLFEESGGIHVTERVANGRLIPVPEPELFSDPSRDVRAVDIALKPLLPGQDSKR
jgi:hypothetical protein